MLDEPLYDVVAILDQPDVEIDEKRGGGEIRQGRELGKRPSRHHLLDSEKLPLLLGLIKQIQGRGEADAVTATHQRLVAKHCSGRHFDDGLEGTFEHQLRKCEQLVSRIPPENGRLDLGGRCHDLLRTHGTLEHARSVIQNPQQSLSPK